MCKCTCVNDSADSTEQRIGPEIQGRDLLRGSMIPDLDLGSVRESLDQLHAMSDALASGSLAEMMHPGRLSREHLGKKIRYQRVRVSGHARLIGVVEMIQHGKGGFYQLELEGGTTINGTQDDGATIEFI